MALTFTHETLPADPKAAIRQMKKTLRAQIGDVQAVFDRLSAVIESRVAEINALKAQGVIVYTILFQENGSSIKTLMKNCATNPDYFFDSPTEESLKKSFQTIGDSLANLRISR